MPLSRHWPEMALMIVAAVAYEYIRGIDLTHDVAWQLWIARQMLHGLQLYRDIWELNPPLWFWTAVPIELLAERFGIWAGRIVIVLTVVMGLFSALLVGRLAPWQGQSQRFMLMCACFCICVLMPMFDFGQREQTALICALPYAALISRRRDGHSLPTGFALVVGLFGAYGFALKHYFVLVPILLELWLLMKLRRDWRPLRPELIALGAAATAYALAVVIFAREFLTTIVPMVDLAYQGYQTPLSQHFDEPAQVIWGLAIIALGLARWQRGQAKAAFTSALCITAAAFAVAYFLQRKGWQYHAIPVTATLLLALVTHMIPYGRHAIARFPLAIVTMAFAALVSFGQGSYNNFLRAGSEPLLDNVAKGEPVAILSADPMWAWPIIDKNGFRWPLHIYSLWMIPSIAHAEMMGPPSPDLEALGDRLRKQTDVDMRCSPPAIILFERRSRYPMQPQGFDVSAFFLRDASLRAFIAQHYAEEPRTRYFRIFRRQHAVTASTDRHCVHAVPPLAPVQ